MMAIGDIITDMAFVTVLIRLMETFPSLQINASSILVPVRSGKAFQSFLLRKLFSTLKLSL